MAEYISQARTSSSRVAPVKLPANFASMSVDELWEIHEEISKLLEAKMLAEKKKLELRLIELHPAKIAHDS
jgi:hypothetical protein